MKEITYVIKVEAKRGESVVHSVVTTPRHAQHEVEIMGMLPDLLQLGEDLHEAVFTVELKMKAGGGVEQDVQITDGAIVPERLKAQVIEMAHAGINELAMFETYVRQVPTGIIVEALAKSVLGSPALAAKLDNIEVLPYEECSCGRCGRMIPVQPDTEDSLLIDINAGGLDFLQPLMRNPFVHLLQARVLDGLADRIKVRVREMVEGSIAELTADARITERMDVIGGKVFPMFQGLVREMAIDGLDPESSEGAEAQEMLELQFRMMDLRRKQSGRVVGAQAQRLLDSVTALGEHGLDSMDVTPLQALLPQVDTPALEAEASAPVPETAEDGAGASAASPG